MRWEQLFADLEGQWEAEARRDLDAEVADRTRRERARVGLYERFSAAVGRPVRLGLAAGVVLAGRVVDAGDGWVLVDAGTGGPALVPSGAIAYVTGLPPRAGGSEAGRRFGLGYALRGLSRDRAVVALTDLTGAVATGTIDAVGADALDLAEHAPEEPRRAGNVTGRRLVPFTALVCVRPA